MVRINALYDVELARLKKLWSGAPPGSLGPMPGPQAAQSAPVPSRPKPAKPRRSDAPEPRLSRASCAAARRARAGSALPLLAFIAWPTSALNAFSLPARNSATDFALAAITVVDDPLERARVAHLAQALGVDQRVDVAAAFVPERVEELARGGVRDRPVGDARDQRRERLGRERDLARARVAFMRRETSPMIQLAASLGSPLAARAAASK